MKSSRSEELFERLSEADEDILGNAYGIDDAEKLRRYVKEKKAKEKRPFSVRRAVVRASKNPTAGRSKMN